MKMKRFIIVAAVTLGLFAPVQPAMAKTDILFGGASIVGFTTRWPFRSAIS
jgi:hypothetical protein